MYGVSLVVTFFFYGIIYFHEKQLYFKVNDIKVFRTCKQSTYYV